MLAAGESKRLKSARPKVVHRVAGRPLIGHVLAALAPAATDRVVVVVSPETRDEVAAAVAASALPEAVFAVQNEPLGTADAVRVALAEHGAGVERALVLPGDGPLITTATIETLLVAQEGAAASLLTAVLDDPFGFGRIVRDGDRIAAIVEEKDATEEQRAICEVNAGGYVFDVEELSRMLDKVDRANAQGEYYLTDVPGLMIADGLEIVTVQAPPDEVLGVNSRLDLATVARVFRDRTCRDLMEAGVTIVDPESTYIEPSVAVGRDAVILPFTFLEGDTQIGEAAEIGPQTRVVDSSIGERAVVTFAVVRGSRIGADATVGPFASIRAGTDLGASGRIGTFVETKSSSIGEASKVPHLAYVGDAEIGRGVNVGAGTITCNWDGTAKHKTIVDDDAYIGSDTMLVAPVHLGKGSATGAGSVVRGDVPDGALAVGVPARIIPGKGHRMGQPVDPPATDADGEAGED